jgi:hypothetical protein
MVVSQRSNEAIAMQALITAEQNRFITSQRERERERERKGYDCLDGVVLVVNG